MDKQQALGKILRLREVFQNGSIPTVKDHEVHPIELDKGSRERYLYFTLAPALNFQRNSPNLWKSAFKTWEDPATQYLFFPEKVLKTDYAVFQKDLTKHKLSLQPNKHAHIWFTICRTLHEQFENDPRKLLDRTGFDVLKVIQCLENNKKGFPYLSGPKLSHYWLYILDYYTDAKFKNKNAISIIPDTHIIQSSIKLGLVSEKVKPEEVVLVWKSLLEGTELSPSHMHSALWHWSRNGFLPEI